MNEEDMVKRTMDLRYPIQDEIQNQTCILCKRKATSILFGLPVCNEHNKNVDTIKI